jgi:tetratricopeptide (TPR) repeat protein
VALLQQERLEEAEKAFLSALSESPDHAPSSVQLARIYSRSGRPEEARRTLERALERRPNGILLLNELGSLLIGENEAAAARPIFERAVTVEPKNPRARLGLAESLGELGDLEGALASLDEALPLGVRHPGLEVYRATVLSQLGRPGDAVEVLERVLESSPDAPEAQRLLGLLAYSLNRDSQAAEVLTRVLARSPADAEARVTLGKIFFRRADYEHARVTFERVLEYDDANEQAHFYLGEIERAAQRFEEAAHHYQKVDSAAARKGLGAALLKMGRYDEAERALEQALAGETEPGERAETLYLLGRLRNERGDDMGSVAALTEASRIDPYQPETRYLLGTILARLGRGEEARKELEAFRSLKAFEERKEKLELAILERPAEADSYRPLIELYLEHGRGAEALPFLEKALALAPGDPALLTLSARLHEGAPRC